ncbi:hypothetical protein MXB_5323 [Myxobolus squamalis]|nr:hypothetical protein MXB_5323 [Myxobolus squamalis]
MFCLLYLLPYLLVITPPCREFWYFHVLFFWFSILYHFHNSNSCILCLIGFLLLLYLYYYDHQIGSALFPQNE